MSSGQREFYCRSKIVSGIRALENVPIELKGYGRERPFVVINRDEAGTKAGKRFMDALGDSGITLPAYMEDSFGAPPLVLAEECAEIFRERGCDSVIAIGGGRALDLARAVNYFAAGGEDAMNPLFFVPGATVSDADMGNSILIDDTVRVSDGFLPEVVFIDKAIGSMDNIRVCMDSALVSFCRAVDGLCGIPHPLRDAFRTSAVSLLYRNLPSFLKNPEDPKSRTGVINGTVHGGIALHNGNAGVVHLMARTLSSVTGYPVSHLMGFILPKVIQQRIIYGMSPDSLLRAMLGIGESSAIPPAERKFRTVEILDRFMELVGKIVPGTLSRVSLSRKDYKDSVALYKNGMDDLSIEAGRMAESIAQSL